MSHSNSAYRGRFAPSPTGPLHLGSLIAALASYLDARHHGGEWLVRMEDIDPPREQVGAADAILHSLQRHGLHWDGEVLFQGTRSDAYETALTELEGTGRLFHCACTRQTLGPNGSCAGRCQGKVPSVDTPTALRVNVPDETVIEFTDLVQGEQVWPLGRDLKDFTVRRKDSLYAYQLAVAVDDLAQDITHIVRGSDLLESTPRQMYLMHCLGNRPPVYGHIPVITGGDGQKLSKQNHAAPLDDARAPENLRAALAFLNQPPPPSEMTTVSEVVSHATRHWSLERVPRVMDLPAQ